MEANNRRDFLKKAALAGASALMTPTLLAAEGKDESEFVLSPSKRTDSQLIVPKNNGLKITGTFLDEISHDIPHQNWGEKEWDLDFQHMKRIGIDTVIMIRSGYRKFITYPSKYLLGKGCYMPSVDLVDMYLRLAEKYNMDVMTMVGFLDGINDSLKEANPIETMEEDTVVSLGFDKEKLYKNMVAAKADWLYNLPQWDAIYSEEERKKLYKEQKESGTIRKEKKIGRNDPCPCGSGKKYKKCCGK